MTRLPLLQMPGLHAPIAMAQLRMAMTHANANGDWVQGIHRACRCGLGTRAQGNREAEHALLFFLNRSGVHGSGACTQSMQALDCMGGPWGAKDGGNAMGAHRRVVSLLDGVFCLFLLGYARGLLQNRLKKPIFAVYLFANVVFWPSFARRPLFMVQPDT